MRNLDAVLELVEMAIALHNAERFGNGGLAIPEHSKEIILEYVRSDDSVIDDRGDLQGVIASVKAFVESMSLAEIDSIDGQWWYDSQNLTGQERRDKEMDFISECLYFDFENGYYIKA